MRFYQLYETNYVDVLRPEIVEFINNNKGYYTEQYVTFSNKEVPEKDDIGINIIPLMQFVKQPMNYVDLANQHNLLTLSVSSPILNIDKLSKNEFNESMRKMNITDIKETFDSVISLSRSKTTNKYGLVLNYVLSHEIKDGDTTDTEISSEQYIKRIIKLGYSGILDSSSKLSNSILSDSYSSMGYLFSNAKYSVDDVVDSEKDIVKDEGVLIPELAVHVANALNSGLNADDPFNQGLDHYFWTYDGMQIRITEIFTDSSDVSNSKAFIFDIETPYGVLYHNSESDDTYDDIRKDIENRYNKMVEPLSNWRPLDRDIFLMNQNLEYKDYEQKMEDIINEVKKYYDEMREFGLRYKIQLKPIKYYTDFDLSFMSGIMERFSQNASAKTFVNKISDNGEMTNMRQLDDFFPRQKLPKKMSFDELEKMALVYDIAKKLQPKKSGWRLFHKIH